LEKFSLSRRRQNLHLIFVTKKTVHGSQNKQKSAIFHVFLSSKLNIFSTVKRQQIFSSIFIVQFFVVNKQSRPAIESIKNDKIQLVEIFDDAKRGKVFVFIQ
jgi:hypothetical protein